MPCIHLWCSFEQSRWLWRAWGHLVVWMVCVYVSLCGLCRHAYLHSDCHMWCYTRSPSHMCVLILQTLKMLLSEMGRFICIIIKWLWPRYCWPLGPPRISFLSVSHAYLQFPARVTLEALANQHKHDLNNHANASSCPLISVLKLLLNNEIIVRWHQAQKLA